MKRILTSLVALIIYYSIIWIAIILIFGITISDWYYWVLVFPSGLIGGWNAINIQNYLRR